MEKTKTFEDLEVWKASHQFVLCVYNVTERFPKTEMFGLINSLEELLCRLQLTLPKVTRKLVKQIS